MNFNPMDFQEERPALSAEQSASYAVLLSQIISAQEKGQKSFINGRFGSIAVPVDGDAEGELDKAAEQVELDLDTLSISIGEPGTNMVFENCTFVGTGPMVITGGELEPLFDELRDQGVQSLEQIEDLVAKHFGDENRADHTGKHYWAVYSDLLEDVFPLDMPQEIVDSVVLPLLNVAEDDWVQRQACVYLYKRGLSVSEIEALWTVKIDKERKLLIEQHKKEESRRSFISWTGVDPRHIRTFDELLDTAKDKHGEPCRMLVGIYLESLPRDTPEEVVQNVVVPWSRREKFPFFDARDFLLKNGYLKEYDALMADEYEESRARFMRGTNGVAPESVRTLNDLRGALAHLNPYSRYSYFVDFINSLPLSSTPLEVVENIVKPVIENRRRPRGEQDRELLVNTARSTVAALDNFEKLVLGIDLRLSLRAAHILRFHLGDEDGEVEDFRA